ncbi:hypothetical protein [Aliarcobacter skirrowii]|uniref:Uncharacterized protein n=1 Tax=Aliarcobacter skirrowii TaxID=28200 RepID=A0A2U2C331_9BACT|nr:hypothetical protein [Aliarcobacter skirrowii]PWE22675.1 hypothetical protein DGF29_01120 [Aliarcobacter skirrowii]PWE23449.1 hypothetical protein DF188_01850 [Aliarcobacter skirrowii]PWE25116.1 hypothetical protein DGE88_07160 [Aliarcobacter skirrowii]RJO56676.1 hypothetical protein DIR39_01890 [Aliarcobacter skirrowii]RJO58630.1 hypothetical protein DIR38_01890 [Aliarcobacter skirrowii]
MNIFIYGKDDFRKDIKRILGESKIDEKLQNISIAEILNLEDLKEQIASNPDDVFLIDDEKIFKKSKFGFLKAKDAIEEEFLLQCGVSELSIDSFEEIPNYITRKYDRLNFKKEPSDSEIINEDDLDNLVLAKDEEKDLNVDSNQSFLEDDIVDTEKKEDNTKDEHTDNFEEDFGLNNIELDYDDKDSLTDKSEAIESMKNEEDILNLDSFISEDFDMKAFKLDEDFDLNSIDEMLLDSDDKNKELFDNNKEEVFINTPENSLDSNFDIENLDEDNNQEEIFLGDIEKQLEESLDLDEVDLKEETQEDNQIKKEYNSAENDVVKEENSNLSIQKEDKSMNNFLDIDSISEADILDALGLDNSKVEMNSSLNSGNNIDDSSDNFKASSIDLNASNIDDVTALLSKLLKNKSVELSIKIKE